MTGLVCRDISQLDDALSTGDATVRVIRDADETVTATVDSLRPRALKTPTTSSTSFPQPPASAKTIGRSSNCGMPAANPRWVLNP